MRVGWGFGEQAGFEGAAVGDGDGDLAGVGECWVRTQECCQPKLKLQGERQAKLQQELMLNVVSDGGRTEIGTSICKVAQGDTKAGWQDQQYVLCQPVVNPAFVACTTSKTTSTVYAS